MRLCAYGENRAIQKIEQLMQVAIYDNPKKTYETNRRIDKLSSRIERLKYDVRRVSIPTQFEPILKARRIK